jgi:hypothetical protein
LVIGQESPCFPLPIGKVLKELEEQKLALSASSFHLGPTMLPFVFLHPNF